MYYRYFGLDEEPFSIAVNPRYLFMSARHRDALAHLLYGVGAGGGFILLTGEVGTGKTTINRCLLEQLPENTDIALILNPAMNAVELLATVCEELEIEHQTGEKSLKVLTDKIHHFLLNNHAAGRNTVLLIDEAQHLQFEVLEQIRLLTNLETNTKKLIQIILVGQPELRSLLNRPELRQLAQRITARFQLKPLNLEETQAYIEHRLSVAGLSDNRMLFSKRIVKGIHRTSRGIPRIINVLCDRMLLGAYGQQKSAVDKTIFKQAIIDVLGESDVELEKVNRYRIPLIIASFALIALVGLYGYQHIVSLSTSLISSNTLSPATELNTATASVKTSSNTGDTLAVEETSKQDFPSFISQEDAIKELALYLGIPESQHNSLCENNIQQYGRCEFINLESWQSLQAFNRPVVLSLVNSAKMQSFAVLIGFEGDQGLLQFSNTQQLVSLQALGKAWTGSAILIWFSPSHFTSPISEGASGPMVEWLAQSFAALDDQDQPLANTVFNFPLSQRVKIFQKNNQLKDDGVVGLKTLLKLNERLKDTKTLNIYPQEGK